ncbi:MAG: AMP-binding protein [Selenomonadaceae bacterium]|nr:AMP-binding protein [Selenomonadaceae bacterium]
MNFYDLLAERAKTFGDKIFLQIDGQSFTYKDFLNAVDNSVAGGKFLTQAVNFFAGQKNNPSNIFEVATSGSTSAPKILRRTFESWANFFPTQNKIFGVDDTTKLFMHGSLTFTGNLNTFLAILYAGGSIVTTEKFSPRRWLELVKISTAIYLVPTKLALLATGTPLENVRSIFTGSQVLTESQSLSLLKKFPAAELILYYGASELSFVTYKKISAENAGEVQNLGKPFDGVKIFIRDGLIYVDTPFRVVGLENPCTVGDAGFIDEHGDLIFFGRGEDFINRGGVKIFASSVEQKLLTIDGVESAAVVKVPDKIRGENFLAFVVGNVDKKNIRQALTPAELPREIFFVKSLPLNSSGKVDKKFLLEQLKNLLAD